MPENTSAKVLRFTLKGLCVTVETVNVFYYAGPVSAESTQAYLDNFRDGIVAFLAPVTNVSMEYNLLELQGVKGTTIFDSAAITIAGTVSGEILPPFVSWDFTLKRGAALERNAYKRFAGVSESQQASGIATAAAETLLDTVADKLDNTLVVGAESWTPVIRRGQINHVLQVPPKFYDISGAVYSRIGSQNSRKYGHGR